MKAGFMDRWLVVVGILLILGAGCTSTPGNSNSGNTSVQNPTGTVTMQAAPTNLTSSELILQLERSVVEINDSALYNDSYYGPTPIGSLGSGVIYSEDSDSIYIVTNRHVVDLGYANEIGIPLQDNVS